MTRNNNATMMPARFHFHSNITIMTRSLVHCRYDLSPISASDVGRVLCVRPPTGVTEYAPRSAQTLPVIMQ